MAGSSEKAGLFQVNYEIGAQLPGAPLFKIRFRVDTVERRVAGTGYVTRSTDSPVNISTMLRGGGRRA